MMLREVVVVVILGIFGFCCSGCFAVNCADVNSILAEHKKCLVSQGISVNLGSKELQNAVQTDPEIVCQEMEKYGPAIRCSLAISRQCVIQFGYSPDIIPDADRVIEGMKYVCDNYKNIDMQCVKDKNATMQQCAIRKTAEAISGRFNVVNMTCMIYNVTSECMRESLASCPRQTMAVLVRYNDVYSTPTACGNQYSGTGGKTTTMAPVEPFTLVTVMPSLPHADCNKTDSIQSAQKQCFLNQSLHIVLSEITLRDGRKTNQSYLDAIMSNSRDFKDICSNELGQYQRAVWCAMEVGRRCMTAGYKDLIPSGRQAQELLVDLCNNADDINHICVNSKASALLNCGFEKDQSLSIKNTTALLCSTYKMSAECHKRELYDCGCKTSRLYIKMNKEHLNPPACPPIDVLPYRCDESTGEYLGSATQSAASVGLLAFSALLVSGIFM